MEYNINKFLFNGIDGSTGMYLTPPLEAAQVAALARDDPIDADHQRDLQRRIDRSQASFAPIEGVDPKDLASTGWGVVFAHNAQAEVRDALRPLLDHRRAQAASAKERRYKEYTRDNGYRAGDPNETKRTFLARGGAAAGLPADPEKVPYYLMIVGGPEAIPYSFQYQLDVQYAVGRLTFETPEEYNRYAISVVDVETNGPNRPRRAVFFGVSNPDDDATRLSTELLLGPLAAAVAADAPEWAVETLSGGSKKKLVAVLGGAETPAFLFTATHGMGFPAGNARQRRHQGALLCQDWPGPAAWRGPIPPDFYLSADDVGTAASVHGLIAFHYAAFSAGTPASDDFMGKAADPQLPLAPASFAAALPQRLLGHPNGGALAVIGLAGRALGYSFFWPRVAHLLQTFRSTLVRLLSGHPVGSATEFLSQRYAELSTTLDELEAMRFGKLRDIDVVHDMVATWAANNDVRIIVVLGDPAVRLAESASLHPALKRLASS